MKQEELQNKITDLFGQALKDSDKDIECPGDNPEILFSESLSMIRVQDPFCLLNFLSFKNSIYVCTSKSERRHYRTTAVTLSVRVVATTAFDLATKITDWFDTARLAAQSIEYNLISGPLNHTHMEVPKAGIFRYDFDISLKFTREIQHPRNLIKEVTDQTGVVYGSKH